MQSQSSEIISDLAHRLSSKEEPTRLQAQEELRTLIAADMRHIYRIQVVLRGIYALWVLLFVASVVYGVPKHIDVVLYYLMRAGVVIMGILYPLALLQGWIALRIIAIDLPQAVGPLIDVLATRTSIGFFPGRKIKVALIRLLPRLQSTDANLLVPRQRSALNRFLRHDDSGRNPFYNADLSVAILRALEQVGDETALPDVRNLAKSAKDARVRSAAQECLPFLQQLVDHPHLENTLLRASGPGSSEKDLS